MSTTLQAQVAPVPPVSVPGATLALRCYLDAYTYRSSVAATARDTIESMLTIALVCLLVGLALSWRVDINKFSLYMMYRLRLVRAYFGASTPQRAPHPFTGFDPNDDPPLADLLPGTPTPKEPKPVQRPYHLINAAVNLVGGKELAWQQRKAGNFVFSPAYCGFELPAMPGSDNHAGVKLGTAVAVSGAAASPNMGYHSSVPLAVLMTLFNLRLGRWSPIRCATNGSSRRHGPGCCTWWRSCWD